MATNSPEKISTHTSLPVDEQEWVDRIKSIVESKIEESAEGTRVSIACVPKTLMSSKPEAYTPQLFAIGPYHHWRPQVYDMECYKLNELRRVQEQLQGVKLDELIKIYLKKEHKIRRSYHRHLEITGETLAWMMAIDTSFLLKFLRNYSRQKHEIDEATKSRRESMRVDDGGTKIPYNMILRDVTMLENQIPLFLLANLLEFQSSSKEAAEEELSKMLKGFVKQVSPFTANKKSYSSFSDAIACHAHLLELLYCSIVPKLKPNIKEVIDENHENIKDKDDIEMGEPEFGDSRQVQGVMNCLWKYLSSLNCGPVTFIKKIIGSKPVKLLLPMFSIIKQPMQDMLSNQNNDEPEPEDKCNNFMGKSPKVEEIMIPSVTELVAAGVKFSATPGDLTMIKFNSKTTTLHLPTVRLGTNTEVVLRNLVAYETMMVPGQMFFTRYTEMMNGIVDTEEDAKILRKIGIIENLMKSDKDVAQMWNGMSKSLKLTKVDILDRVIADVNKYYKSRWTVQSRQFMKKYIYGSWQVLTFLAAALLLIMTCVQSFCSVYSCSSHLTQITSIVEQS